MKMIGLLPFMDNEELKELALKIFNGEVKGIKLVVLYPFLSNEDLDEIIDLCIEKGFTKQITHALPFVSKSTLNKIYDGVKEGTITGVKESSLYPFLGKDKIKSIFDDLVNEASMAAQEAEENQEVYEDEEVPEEPELDQ